MMDALECIMTRRSIRRFKQDPIPHETLEKLVNAGRLAASAANLQPWSFVVVETPELMEEIFPTLGWLKGAGGPSHETAPVACIVILGNPSIFKLYEGDCGAAAQNIILAAWALGLGSCWIGAVKKPELSKVIPVPEEFKIYACIALGVPGEKAALSGGFGTAVTRREDGVVAVDKRKAEDIVTYL